MNGQGRPAAMDSISWQFYFDKTPVADFDALLDRYEVKEFASPTRSTLPLLAFVKHGWPMFQPVLSDFGFHGGGLHFEVKVDPVRGRGKASHTDLMVQSSCAAVAFEAKWTEPEYASVSEWFERAATPNKRLVLQRWTDLVQPFCKSAVERRRFRRHRVSNGTSRSVCVRGRSSRGKQHGASRVSRFRTDAIARRSLAALSSETRRIAPTARRFSGLRVQPGVRENAGGATRTGRGRRSANGITQRNDV